VERGATVVLGGGRTDPASNVLEPTVLTDLDSHSSILREETFGPVLPVVPVRDAEDAVRHANSGSLGLSASVWTQDRALGLSVAQRLRAGAVCINDVLTYYGVPGLPFGGVGESGFGKNKGLEGLGEFTRSRSVVVDRLGLKREPWWFPYSKSSERLLRAALLYRWKGGLRGLAAGVAFLLRRKRG
jgi:acyl-CoA reductase-like NAD-dependent aldehyde dehydrogenase